MKLHARPSVFLFASVALLLAANIHAAATAKEKPGITIDWGNTKIDGDKGDARYSAQGLKQAFAALCKTLRYRAIRVEVDQSEFPYLVYGVLDGRCDYRDMRDALHSMSGYAYSGCVTMSQRDGATTIFALNMTPQSEYAREGGREAMMRIMDRMRALAMSQR